MDTAFDPTAFVYALPDRSRELLQLSHRLQLLPPDCVVFDMETSGFSRQDDLVLEASLATVRAGEVVSVQTWLLNWADCPGMDERWLNQRLERTRENMAKRGDVFRFNADYLRQGAPAMEGFHELVQTLYDLLKTGQPVCGHNVWAFDSSIVDACTTRMMNGYLLPWQNGGLFDTGLFEKALQLGTAPWPGEPLHQWWKRVASTFAAGVKWSLFKHCVPKYALTDRHTLDVADAHTSACDCYATAALYKTFRELSEIACRIS